MTDTNLTLMVANVEGALSTMVGEDVRFDYVKRDGTVSTMRGIIEAFNGDTPAKRVVIVMTDKGYRSAALSTMSMWRAVADCETCGNEYDWDDMPCRVVDECSGGHCGKDECYSWACARHIL